MKLKTLIYAVVLLIVALTPVDVKSGLWQIDYLCDTNSEINGIEHHFTLWKKEMLCKFCANWRKEKVKRLKIKHLTFRFVGVTAQL